MKYSILLLLLVMIIWDSAQAQSTPIQTRASSSDPIRKSWMGYSFITLPFNSKGKFCGLGTGFFLPYNGRCYFVTCRHVAFREGSTFIMVVDPTDNRNRFNIKLGKPNPDEDIASFQLDSVPTWIRPVPYLIRIDGKMSDSVHVMGFVHSDEKDILANIMPARCQEWNDYQIHEEARKYPRLAQYSVSDAVRIDSVFLNGQNLQEGFSGAPVFGYFGPSKQILLLGMIQHGDSVHHVSHGLSFTHIERYLR